ncbi:MAG: matrixin family metalloprotease [Candidatus Obscuribacterales bacterium]|jgi:tetratricopeptide (TPR) repeat protein|nr:matrixin family metalloprotease [Candidatus Obscuribacterales bacterium]
MSNRRKIASLLLGIYLFAPGTAIAAAPPAKEAIESYSLDKLYEEISKCYQTGDLERAAVLYKRALVLIEKTGNKKALEEAKANYQKLVDKLAAKSGTQTPAKTASAASAQPTRRQPDFSGFDIGKSKPAERTSSEFQKSDSSWRKRLDERSNQFKGYELDEQAREYSTHGDNTKALATIKEAIKLWPDSGSVWFNKGLIESQLSKWEDAVASFQKAQSLDNEIAFKCQKRIAQATAEMGSSAKASELLWKLKRDSRSDYSNEKEIDGLLVQIGDEKAISNNTILANASERNLMIAIKNASGASRASTLLTLCKQLQNRGQSANNEQYMGYYLAKASQYEDALAAYKRADDYDPSDKDGLIGIMSMAGQLGKLEEVQAARVAYVDRFPSDEKSKSYREAIAYYKDDFEKTRAREKQASNTVADRPHFAKSEMPLKVFVPDIGSATSNWAEPADPSLDYDGIVQRVMNEWTSACEGHVTFEKVQSADRANISIEWVEGKDKMEHSFAAGTTGYATNASGQRRHNLKLLAPTKNSNTDAEHLYGVTLHEFGHSLGLSHSSSPNDVMYYSGSRSGQNALSENDRKRINELYK